MEEEPTLIHTSSSVSISEYVLLQENWLKVLKYVIKTTDSSGDTATLRSAKDFKVLRKILVARWPGCIIPIIPESYSKVNFNQKNPNPALFEHCLYVHDSFLSKIVAVDYFFNSDVVQLFIKGPADFVKLTKAYKIPTYAMIAENFESNFKDGLDYQLDSETLTKLLDIKFNYVETLKNIVMLEKTCNDNNKNMKDYKKATSGMFKVVQETYKWLNNGHEENEIVFDEFDPYNKLFKWILDQFQDLNAVVEAILKVEELIKVKEITNNSIKTISIEIHKLGLSKNSLMAILNNKSKDDLLKAKQNLLEDLNGQVKALDIIIPVVTSKLLNIDIPAIENTNLASFDSEIKSFTQALISDFEAVKAKIS